MTVYHNRLSRFHILFFIFVLLAPRGLLQMSPGCHFQRNILSTREHSIKLPHGTNSSNLIIHGFLIKTFDSQNFQNKILFANSVEAPSKSKQKSDFGQNKRKI